MDKNIAGEVLSWQQKLFSCSVRRQVRLKKTKQLLGNTAGQRCLEVTAGDGMISQCLRLEGGTWTTLALTSQLKESLEYFVREDVYAIEDGKIDAPDNTFHAVVIVDALEWMEDDLSFIKECHRVLRTDGRLVITTARKISFFVMIRFLRLLFGESWHRRGLARNGYSRKEFFEVFRDGFDVPETTSYSTCCIEFPGLLCELIANKIMHGPYNMPAANMHPWQCSAYQKLYLFGLIGFPWFWVFSKLEPVFLFVLPGNNLIAQMKRRVWRERRTPVLVDGRSIAEAAINTKIGTAAPF